MTNNLKPGERLDDLQIKGYEIIQSPGRFCFGMDAVFLSAFAKVKAGECVLDLGTGTGILPILLAAKTKGKHFTGLEIQEESADMACRSVRHNRLEEQIDIVTGDIKEASQIFGKGSMDVITTNPPYMIGGHGMANPESAKAIARHEVLCTLEEAKLEPKRMRLVYPYVDKEPNMVLIEGIRGAKSRMTVDPPLIVYEKDGSYTREILEYYGMTGTGKE